ncbi:MAG: VTT domain-containing protein [Gammaproteobacteria bacterium]|nr:VTT domain-containing protein [Gammaproteobacteria bacterium]MCW9058503.1 VTT domain-containing protein [Gammaproteobacteria bacterium]
MGNSLPRGLLGIGLLLLLGFGLQALRSGVWLDQAWIDAEVLGQGLRGEALFFLAALLFTALGLPRQVVGFFAGYAFGLGVGGLLALAASLGGALLTFSVARWLGRDLVRRWFTRRLGGLDEFVGDHPLRTILLIRLLPLGSNLATNLAAGISRMGAWPFAAGSALGYLPQTLVFALIGSGIAVDPLWRIGTGILLFLLSGLLGLSLFRRFRLRKSTRQSGFDLDPAGK